MIFNIFLILIGFGLGYFFAWRRFAFRRQPDENVKSEVPLPISVKVCISKGGIPIINKDGVMEDCVFPPYEGSGKRAK